MEENQTVVNEPVDAVQEVETVESQESTETQETTEIPMPNQDETVESQEVDAPKPDENVGEAIKKEVERRAEKVRKEYESQLEEIRKENEYLDKLARMNGFRDRHEFKKHVDELARQQEIEQEANRLGIDPETYLQHLEPVNKKLSDLEQKVQTYEQQLSEKEQQERAQQQWGALYEAYPHLLEQAKAWEKGDNPEFYTEKMQEYINKGYEPIDAYELAHKETLFKAKEQEVLARVTERDQKQVLPSTDQPSNIQFDPANMDFEDILKISERVQRGERITF